MLRTAASFHALSTLVLALIVSASAVAIFPTFPLAESAWLILPALLFSQLNPQKEQATRARQLIFFATTILAAAFVFLLSWSANDFYLAAGFLGVTTFVSVYWGWKHSAYFLNALFFNSFCILATFSPATLLIAGQRCALIAVAGLLVFISHHLFFSYRRTRTFFYVQRQFLQALAEIYELLFSYYRDPNYLSHRDSDEANFQTAWTAALADLQQFNTQLTVLAQPQQSEIQDCLARIWDISLSLGALRYRLNETSFFTLSHQEIAAVAQAVHQILGEAAQEKGPQGLPLDFSNLTDAILGLEYLYGSVLQSVVADPLGLLLFIQDLFALKENLERLVVARLAEKGGRIHVH